MTKNRGRLDRRGFLTLAGASIGASAIAAIECSGWSKNESKIDPDKVKQSKHNTDVLVIGGGMAGLFAAVKAHDAGAKVMIVSKGRLGASGQTPFAKGIFAFDAKREKLTLDQFVDEVSRSAMGTNNPVYTRQMAAYSLARVNELRAWGFFDSPLYHDTFSKPIRERNIPVLERLTITHIIKENDRIAGAAGFSLDDQQLHLFRATSIILCTGAGGFKPNGFPICDLTHDGTVMAYRIGAKVTGKEWNDGHPGQATNAAACFDGWHGMFERTPGTTGVSIRHDLGVELNYMAYKLGNPVSMRPPGVVNGAALAGGPSRPDGLEQRHPGEKERGHRPPRPPDGRPPRGKRPDGPPPGMRGTTVGGGFGRYGDSQVRRSGPHQ